MARLSSGWQRRGVEPSGQPDARPVHQVPDQVGGTSGMVISGDRYTCYTRRRATAREPLQFDRRWQMGRRSDECRGDRARAGTDIHPRFAARAAQPSHQHRQRARFIAAVAPRRRRR